MSHSKTVTVATRSRRPRGRGIAVLAVLAVLAVTVGVAGCGTSPGAAAEVDGVRIAEQLVGDRTAEYLAEVMPGVDVAGDTRAMINRYQVTDLIRHQLAIEAADAHGITITPADINAFLAANGGAANVAGLLTIPSSAAADAVFDYLVLQQLVTDLPAEGVPATDVTVMVDAVPTADRAEAVALREKYLADPAAFDADAEAARAAGTAPGGEENLFGSAHDAQVGIFSAAAGEILLFSRQDGSFYVIRVTERGEAPAQLTQDVIYGAQSIEGYLVLASQLLSDYADDVSVNPRFGEWDPATLMVLPSTRSL